MADTPDVLKRLEEIEDYTQERVCPPSPEDLAWLLRLARALLESQEQVGCGCADCQGGCHA